MLKICISGPTISVIYHNHFIWEPLYFCFIYTTILTSMSVHVFGVRCVCVRPSQTNFVESKDVTNKSCHICFSDEKNPPHGVSPPRGPWVAPGRTAPPEELGCTRRRRVPSSNIIKSTCFIAVSKSKC